MSWVITKCVDQDLVVNLETESSGGLVSPQVLHGNKFAILTDVDGSDPSNSNLEHARKNLSLVLGQSWNDIVRRGASHCRLSQFICQGCACNGWCMCFIRASEIRQQYVLHFFCFRFLRFLQTLIEMEGSLMQFRFWMMLNLAYKSMAQMQVMLTM